jgi:hypothetical protein
MYQLNSWSLGSSIKLGVPPATRDHIYEFSGHSEALDGILAPNYSKNSFTQTQRKAEEENTELGMPIVLST